MEQWIAAAFADACVCGGLLSVARCETLQVREATKDFGNPAHWQTFRGTAAGNQEGAQSAKSWQGRLHHESSPLRVRRRAHSRGDACNALSDHQPSGVWSPETALPWKPVC